MKNLLFGLLFCLGTAGWSQNYVVTNNASGAGSFSEAVGFANSDGVPSTITFDPVATGGIVFLDGSLLFTEDDTFVDGDDDGDGLPDISVFTSTADILEIQASNITIKSLNLFLNGDQPAGNAAIKIDGIGATNNTVIGCYIGTFPDGTTPIPGPNLFHRGIMIINGASNNRIGGTTPEERNVISNSDASGIYIQNSDFNDIFGNLIGTDISGTIAVPNGGNGVEIEGSTGTRIGSPGGIRNVISGNDFSGVRASSSPSTIIINNHIGVTEVGNSPLGNQREGILLRAGSDNALIGTGDPGDGNIISGNGFEGIEIAASDQAFLYGNLVGVSRNGLIDLGNGQSGIRITSGSDNNVIGADSDDERNVISGNGVHGIRLGGDGTRVEGNYIGTTRSGNSALGNDQGGIFVDFDTFGNHAIGAPGGGNIISGNDFGIVMRGSGNSISHNIIGLNRNENGVISNANEGISIVEDAFSNVVDFNVIGGNNIGILLRDALVQDNFIDNNILGTGAGGGNYPNTQYGIAIELDANSNLISNNLVLNSDVGIFLDGSSTEFNELTGNEVSNNIGNGILIQAGAQQGILPPTVDSFNPVDAQSFEVIGTADPNVPVEVFADPAEEGLVFLGSTNSDATGNWSIIVFWDFLTSTDGNITATQFSDPGGFGLRNTSEFSAPLSLTFPDPLIVTTTVNESVIGSFRYAVEYLNSLGVAATITFDPIVLDQQINLESPVVLTANNSTIDGDITGDCLPNITISGINIPAGSTGDNADGIIVNSNNNTLQHLNLQSFDISAWGDAINITGDNNQVLGSFIGTDLNGTAAAGTGNYSGILLNGGTGNTIGGLASCSQNLISGNVRGVVSRNTSGSQIIGNLIGTDLSGTTSLGNTTGVLITTGAASTIVGSTDILGRNVISGNQAGVRTDATAGVGTVIIGNFIGTDITGTLSVSNVSGITSFANGDAIGNGSSDGRNIISGNSTSGIQFQNGGNSSVRGNFIGVDITGSVSLGNGTQGIYFLGGSTNNTIGGINSGDRNIISGNGIGLEITTANNFIFGNYIGTDVSGSVAIPNGVGVRMIGSTSTGNDIGFGEASTRNIISGNTSSGIVLWSSDNSVNDNYIGVNRSLNPLPNGENGISINIVATGNSVSSSVIAFNGEHGIRVGNSATAEKNRFSQNSIYSNVLKGIQLDNNTQENVLPPSISNTTSTQIDGLAAPNALIRVYADSIDEGQFFIGQAFADAAGDWSLPYDQALLPVGLGFATATQDSASNTSEFSIPAALNIPPMGPFIVINTNDSGLGSLREAMTFANANPGPDQILFDIPITDPGYDAFGEIWNIEIVSQLPDIAEEVTIDGYSQPGNMISRIRVNGAGTNKFFSIISSGGSDFNFYGIQFFDGDASENGGAIDFSSSGSGDRLRFYDCIFENNFSSTDNGGALFFSTPVSVFIQDSYFINNETELDGGAIAGAADGLISIERSEFRGNKAYLGRGGAIGISGAHSLSIESCSFSGNEALNTDGAAVFIGNSSHSIVNTTFSGNSGRDGGALYMSGSSGSVSILSSTFFNNTGSNTIGDILVEAGSVTVSHTVLENFTVLPGATLNSNGHNFIAEDQSPPFSSASGDIVGPFGNPIDPQLGPLQLNGGLTLNHAPLTGSQLLDAGDRDDLTPYPKDQRGLLRVDGVEADIGAVELQVSPDLDKIYWTERVGRDVNRSNIDGTKFENWGLNPSTDPNGLAVDTVSNKLYWADNNEGSVYRGDITPRGIENIETLYMVEDSPASDIVLDLTNGKMYWAEIITGSIHRANLDGSALELNFISGFENILGIAIDLLHARIYWTSNDETAGDNVPSIWEASLINGSGATLFYSEPAVSGENYQFVDIDYNPLSQELYWSAGQEFQTGNNKFYVSSTAATPTPAILADVRGQPGGFEADWVNGKIYFVDDGVASAEPPTLWVMDIDGSNQTALLEGVSEGITTPKYLALGFPTVGSSVSISFPVITILGSSVICPGDSVELESSVGDSYQWYRNGQLIPGADQRSFFTSTAGNYNVQVQDGPDLEFALTDAVLTTGVVPTITSQPTDQSACDGSGVSIAANATGVALIYGWFEDSGTGFTKLNDGQGIAGTSTPNLMLMSSSGLDGNRYVLQITENGSPGNCSVETDTVTIAEGVSPTINIGNDFTICSSELINITAVLGGSATLAAWETLGDGAFNDTTLLAPTYNPGPGDLTAGTVTLSATSDAPGSCFAASDQIVITLDPSTIVDAGSDQNICPSDLVILAGVLDANGTNPIWTTTGDGSFTDLNNPGTTYSPGSSDISDGSVLLVLTASPPSGLCSDVSDTLEVIINQPISSQEQTATVDLGQTISLNLLNGAQVNPGDQITVTIVAGPSKGQITTPSNGVILYTPNSGTVGIDTVDFEICNQCGLCDQGLALIEILNSPPIGNAPQIPAQTGSQITLDLSTIVTDPNNNIDLSSVQIISGPAPGATASLNGFELIVDYSNSDFFGVDIILVEVCDLSGACIQVEIFISISREDVNIINAVTPNGDGRHDFFEIENIQFYENNTVKIFNRWGEQVFFVENYDNASRVFTGRDEPAGTYYYIIDLKDGSAKRTGNLLLKK